MTPNKLVATYILCIVLLAVVAVLEYFNAAFNLQLGDINYYPR